MNNQIENYKKQFKTDTMELIVHTSWCWEKVRAKPPMLGNYYQVKARFDKAIDVNTGKIIEGYAFNWLEWLAPKKMFG